MCADVSEYAGSQFIHEPGAAGHVQKFDRRQPAPLRVLPANQGLHALQLFSGTIHNRLVEHIQAIGFQCFPQFALKGKAGARCHLDFRVKQGGTVPALPFGMVHGGLGTPEKFFRLTAVTREVTDAQAGTDGQILVGYPDWLANPALDLPGYFIQGARQGVIADDQRKFVAADARQKVFACQLDLFQPQTDIGDHLIPCLGPQAVIDGFKAVNIDPDKSQAACTPAFDLAYQMTQPVSEGIDIGKASQGIVTPDVFQGPLGSQPGFVGIHQADGVSNGHGQGNVGDGPLPAFMGFQADHPTELLAIKDGGVEHGVDILNGQVAPVERPGPGIILGILHGNNSFRRNGLKVFGMIGPEETVADTFFFNPVVTSRLSFIVQPFAGYAVTLRGKPPDACPLNTQQPGTQFREGRQFPGPGHFDETDVMTQLHQGFVVGHEDFTVTHGRAQYVVLLSVYEQLSDAAWCG